MKLFFTILSLVIFKIGFGQENQLIEKPTIDERIELLSIVFRLAGCSEYSSELFKTYTDKINEHYQPFKEHPLIIFTKELRLKNGVGYDAVMNMAIHLNNELKPLIEFNDKIPDERWGKNNAGKFIDLLQRFYFDTNSDHFFRTNKGLFEKLTESFTPIYRELDINWYKSFYGKEPNEEFLIILSPGNGYSNYGPSISLPNGKRKVYSILGVSETDHAGNAKFTFEKYFPLLLHEFNHSFVNYLLERNPEPFTENGEKIYKALEPEMREQAYGNWETMINEALVRAAVIKYMIDHDYSPKEIEREINEQLGRSFFWIIELVDELIKYDQNRNEFKTLESYYNVIAKAYNNFASKTNDYLNSRNKKRPKIISISEFTNGNQEVDHEIKTITINFDREIRDGYSFDKGKKGEDFLPEVIKVEMHENRKSVTLFVELKPNKEYQFLATRYGFKSIDGIPINDFEINFKTKP